MRYDHLVGAATGLLLALASTGAVSAEPGYTTWYGPGFHGNVTANGEWFDENNPTTTAAAYRFPFGAWLKVTNPANGKFVHVRVNDRGAFSHALDLSKAAFFALEPPNPWGFWVDIDVVDGPGLDPAPVQPPRPTPEPPKPAPALAPASAPARPAAPAPALKPAAAPSPATEHVVERGQTLRAVAALHAVPLRSLIDWNELENPDALKPGQRLRLTAPTRTYEVVAGDTLSSISRANGVPVSRIIEMNKIEQPDALSIGQKLVLPA